MCREVHGLRLLDRELAGLGVLLELREVGNTGPWRLIVRNTENLAIDVEDGREVWVLGDELGLCKCKGRETSEEPYSHARARRGKEKLYLSLAESVVCKMVCYGAVFCNYAASNVVAVLSCTQVHKPLTNLPGSY
jgi:hypothetical protein